MNLKTGKEALAAIAEKVRSFFSKGKGAQAAQSANIGSAMVAKVNPANILRVYGALSIAEFAAKPVDDVLGGLIGATNKLTVMPAKYTIGLIPGVNKILALIPRTTATLLELAGLPTLAKWSRQQEQALVNDPSFYEHILRDDGDFMLPSNYNNTLLAITAGQSAVNVPSVVTFQMVKPFYANRDAAKLRAQRIYTVITAAMRVAHTVYDWKHILAYMAELDVLYTYYVYMKKIISASQATTSLKPNMPKALLKQINVDPDEVSTNIGLYTDYFRLWCSKVNDFGLSVMGIMPDKIKATALLLKDSEINNCTYYNMLYLLPDTPDVKDKVYNQQTISYDVAIHEEDQPSPEIVDHHIYNYQELKDYGEAILSAFAEDEIYGKLISDFLTVFGTTKLVKVDDNYYDIYSTAKYDKLQLDTLKNATIDICMQPKLTFGMPDGSYIHERMHLYSMTFQTSTARCIAQYCNDLNTIAQPSGTSIEIPATSKWEYTNHSVPMDGSGVGFDLTNPVLGGADIMNLAEKKYENGKAYEVITKKWALTSGSVYATKRSTGNQRYSMELTVTPLLEVIVDIVNDVDITGSINHDFCYQFKSYSDTSTKVSPRVITLWSLVDWFPRIQVDLDDSTRYELWDMDNIGELTENMFGKANYNITYSLFFPNIKAQLEKGKQIESLVDMYSK